MSLSFSETSELYKLKALAKEKGRDDLIPEIDALLASDDNQVDLMSREGRVYEKEFKAEQLEYRENKDASVQLSELLRQAEEKGRDALIAEIQALKSVVDKTVYDYEDITEEIRGAGSAALEAVSVGALGDEAQSWAIAGLTGQDYDTVLEDTRRIQEEFAEDLPVLDLGIRIAAGFIPSVRLAKALGVGKTFAGGAARQGGLTAGEIGAYSFFEGEGDAGSRLENVARTFQDPLAIGAVGLGGGLGGIAGRSVGKAKQLEEAVEKAIKGEEKKLERLRTGKDRTVGTDVVDASQQSADQAVIRFYNQNGRMPEGTEITQIYREMSEEIGVPINRIMQSEMKAGQRRLDLDYRTKSIEDIRKRVKVSGDFVTETQATTSRGILKDFYEDKLEPIVEVAKRRIGEKAAGNFQRMATNMARQQQDFDTMFNTDQVQAFARALEADSGVIKQRILNFSNSNLDNVVRRKEFSELKKLLTKEQMDGLRAMLRIRADQAGQYRKFVFKGVPIDPLYVPSRTLAQSNKAALFNRRNMPRNAVDENMMERKRGYLTEGQAADYENPIIVMRDKIAHDEAVIQLHKNFKLNNNTNKITQATEETKDQVTKQVRREVEEGSASFVQLREALKEEGANDGVIKTAEEFVRSLIVRGTTGPSGALANIRKAAYMGTIGNPYSALLNFGDVGNTVVNFGADNTGAALVNMLKRDGIRVGVQDVGLVNQASGEFLREGSTKWNRRFNLMSDLTFKGSGFRAADVAGKTVTLNAAVQRGRMMAADGSLLSEYNWLFGRQELLNLRKDLLANKKTDRVREFAAAELAKLQPSDLAQMPKWYLDHPNGRLLYMLRTFGLKQLQQVKRLVFETWKEGVKRNDNNLKKEAIKNAAAYVVVVGGGNTLLNELRQPIKGKRDAFEMDEMEDYFIDFMLGVATVNTQSQYTLEKLVKGDARAAIKAFFPAPLNMSEDVVGDIAAGLFDEKDIDELFFEGKGVRWLPFMRVAQPYLEEEFD